MLSKVFLHGTPEELNKIKFTVKLGKEDADVTCSFNHLLHKDESGGIGDMEGVLGTEGPRNKSYSRPMNYFSSIVLA